MPTPATLPRLKGFRFPREIVAYAVWAYHRFALSTADVEDLLAERGVVVSREAIRLWINRFGDHFAACIKRDRPRPADKWRLDEVVIAINGQTHWLWRAVDAEGDMLNIFVQKHRNAKAAKRFLARLIDRFGEPRVVVTDKLCSYIKPISALAPGADHRAHKGLNNHAEGSHRPTRKREKIMGRFKSLAQAQRFLAATACPPPHTATPAPTPSLSGRSTRSRWPPDQAALVPSRAKNQQLGNAPRGGSQITKPIVLPRTAHVWQQQLDGANWRHNRTSRSRSWRRARTPWRPRASASS